VAKKHLARQQQASVQQQIAVRGEVYSGPLPHPDVLIKYNQAVPNAAERILQMAESQAKHRQALEDRVTRANVRNQLLGSIFGFVLGSAAIGGGISDRNRKGCDRTCFHHNGASLIGRRFHFRSPGTGT